MVAVPEFDAVPHVDAYWTALVTTALLGTDRRDPPEGPSAITDLVADAVRPEPAERLLVAIAACTAVRRAGVLPGASVDPLAPPASDPRPSCLPAAVERWHHLVAAWPILEDEWTLTLVEQGWRLAPELVAPMLLRHRRNPVRRARVVVAAGPVANWLVGHLDELASTQQRPLTPSEAERLGELPTLPLPAEFQSLLDEPGARIGGFVASGLEGRSLVESHRAVLVNLLARCAPGGLGDIADVLQAVDQRSPGFGLAMSLSDLATTRARLIEELTVEEPMQSRESRRSFLA